MVLFFQKKEYYFETPKGIKIVEQNAVEDKKLIDAKFKRLEKKARQIGARVVMNEDENEEEEETLMLKNLEKNQGEGVVKWEEEMREGGIKEELFAERNDHTEVRLFSKMMIVRSEEVQQKEDRENQL